jgi:hypothetical protein
MLCARDISGLFKQGQQGYGFDTYSRPQSLPTFADLINEVRRDQGLSPVERMRLLEQIKSLVGTSSPSTPLSSLMYKGLGGTLGYLISKYFGMGTTGKVLSSVAGFGIGKVLYDKLNAPPNPYRGYKFL